MAVIWFFIINYKVFFILTVLHDTNFIRVGLYGAYNTGGVENPPYVAVFNLFTKKSWFFFFGPHNSNILNKHFLFTTFYFFLKFLIFNFILKTLLSFNIYLTFLYLFPHSPFKLYLWDWIKKTIKIYIIKFKDTGRGKISPSYYGRGSKSPVVAV